ncbi:glycosyltransferase involved in cell wall biosynthesis [Salinibacter ruber]|uniref:glycosyltransferase family 4 protein n=1 Tax=Salinibacter ruber TaxID=146919 RepID=UPI0021688B7F|nr:glycosyltransferase family 4 protein [Salinibacter ruber]MCS3628936.1 glycosyltransferase involved in cell wall biosynthesis [Salinibacter ruber]MCS4145845.1 glycosyltransferase involved in cell wall biosynthesis [Salinibacter ruber]
MHILALLTDAYGHRGGIAKFNRDLCRALTADPLAAQVTALPRVPPVEPIDNVPPRVTYHPEAAGSKLTYAWHTLRHTCNVQRATFNAIICGHINLLPVAALASWLQGAPLILILHGIDAWTPHDSWLVRKLLPQVDTFVTVSQCTKDRFLDWVPLRADQGHVIPDCIDLDAYSPGPKRDELLDRYDLHDRTVLLTLGRLSSEEQYKGHDEILEVLPDLADEIPDVAYLVCGDGDDRPRLERKAERLGVADRTVFAGYVPEEEKEDHYRLADAFVMPGRGEGFGIVYLEAMACGVPVVASSADASREAVRDGQLGVVVDPDDPDDIKRGVYRVLDADREVPDGLDYFSYNNFEARWHRLLRENTVLSNHSL